MSETKKVCLVTGATNGVGRAAAHQLAAQGWTVVLVGRDLARCEETVAHIRSKTGNGDVHHLLADLSLVSEVRKAAREFRGRFDRLDVLANNAGAIFQKRGTTKEGFERTFALNHLAYFALTNDLLDMLKASAPARVVSVSSGAHLAGHIHFEDVHLERRYSTFTAYGQSKLANVLFTKELARRLEGTGVTANCLHPGFVGSGFALNNGALARALLKLLSPLTRTPDEGAETLVWLATAPELASTSGKYFHDKREARISREAADPAVARRLWELSERLVQQVAPG